VLELVEGVLEAKIDHVQISLNCGTDVRGVGGGRSRCREGHAGCEKNVLELHREGLKFDMRMKPIYVSLYQVI
jgi:hypothetical protein